jgi:hypothetical protein
MYRRSKTQPKSSSFVPKLQQFQIVTTGEGREWTVYGLDKDGWMWFRYWKETGRVGCTRRLTGFWEKWKPLDRDKRA